MKCIIVDDDDASRTVLTQLAKQVDGLTVVKVCSRSLEAIDAIEKEDIDLVFLDIEMPELNGMEMLKALSKRPQVVITTAHKEHAVAAFELNVVDYLVKPITLPRFLKTMSKVKDNAAEKEPVLTGPEFFFIKKNSVLNKVPVKDILWIEALGDYITLHSRGEKFIIHTTLKSIDGRLQGNKFVRVHRSYIVQVDNVTKVEDTTIYINDMSIPIGALYREDFLKHINPL
jgi:DNA-binding LytR/AlgR family response regulator